MRCPTGLMAMCYWRSEDAVDLPGGDGGGTHPDNTPATIVITPSTSIIDQSGKVSGAKTGSTKADLKRCSKVPRSRRRGGIPLRTSGWDMGALLKGRAGQAVSSINGGRKAMGRLLFHPPHYSIASAGETDHVVGNQRSELCDRRNGVGADGLVILSPEGADGEIQIVAQREHPIHRLHRGTYRDLSDL